MATRGLLLSATYAAIFVLGWPMLVLTLVGVADIFIDLRQRSINKRGPPPALHR